MYKNQLKFKILHNPNPFNSKPEQLIPFERSKSAPLFDEKATLYAVREAK